MLTTNASSKIFSKASTAELVGHTRKVHCLSWNPKGGLLGSGGVDCVARIWDVEKLQQKAELEGHTSSIEQLKWDPTANVFFVSASLDHKVLFWDLRARNSEPVASVETQGENINLAWSQDGVYCAVGDKDDNLSFIDVRKFDFFERFQFAEEVNEFKWSPSGPFFFMTLGKEVLVFRWPTMEQQLRLQVHADRCYCLEFDRSGRYFALGGADSIISLWETEYMLCTWTVDRLEYPIRTISFSHDGQFIAAGSEDSVIDISDILNGRQTYALGVKGATNVVAWHPSRHLLAYATEEEYSRDGVAIHLYGTISKDNI
ncbi:THO complex subunit 3 [Galdieria sulphuraria]|uniref:Transducin family protein / WD-40 repeat family protein n=1 Tax=Galdieria sulphuraria TaxID=130081 RepID=M2XNM3_GALSU|nr:transducin family protein / WD-40 repeat family protein [Galdieria sulphuraria]EME31787.1 transducin family protein / WD-40 repeat family protein [Galdieria sulphuraria]GJD10292.1 THO complex subunit 3 [Galdieria sulphuraria]|eukprot:XP_005708307.1 transducin family protein / WD-40 repeat family protein [Galdieria sulphuraria]